MAQKEIEIILMRQLASYLAMPIFIVDPAGRLLFYNEPAELILGFRYEEAGEMPEEEWTTVFTPMDERGDPVPPGDLPLVVARNEGHPAQLNFWIRGLDTRLRYIQVVAFPLIGQAGRNLGAVALFWEAGTDEGHAVGNAGVAGLART